MPSRPRPPPKGRRTDAEVRAARGHNNSELHARTVSHIGRIIQREIVLPTIEGQARTRRRLQDYLKILQTEDEGFLEKLDYASISDILRPNQKTLPTCLLPLFPVPHTTTDLITDVILGFIDYLAEACQGMIEERITVSTLVNDIGLFIGMVSSSVFQFHRPLLTGLCSIIAPRILSFHRLSQGSSLQ